MNCHHIFVFNELVPHFDFYLFKMWFFYINKISLIVYRESLVAEGGFNKKFSELFPKKNSENTEKCRNYS